MKRYTFELIIEEGCDEFWDALIKKPGCEEVLEAVKIALAQHGWDADYESPSTFVRLVKFEEK